MSDFKFTFMESTRIDMAAYLGRMRRGGHSKVYDVNPFCEVFSDTKDVYYLYVKSPGSGGDPWMHLVVGPEKAILIDTAYGIGDLKGLVETITDKPYYVVNTHFHGDHSMGNYQFDKVYAHYMDVPSLKAQLDPKARERFAPSEGAYYKASDLVPTKDYEIIGVEDGHIFDLGGGHVVELIHIPGHAPGGCAFLDKKNRMLFSGDAIVNTPTFIFGEPSGEFADYMTIRSYKTSLEKLYTRLDEFDGLYPGHSMLALEPSIVPQMVLVCDSIINNPKLFDEDLSFIGRNAFVRFIGKASIAFSEARI